MANRVAPEYKQKSYGKYELNKLLVYVCIIANMGKIYTNIFSKIVRSNLVFSNIDM